MGIFISFFKNHLMLPLQQLELFDLNILLEAILGEANMLIQFLTVPNLKHQHYFPTLTYYSAHVPLFMDLNLLAE